MITYAVAEWSWHGELSLYLHISEIYSQSYSVELALRDGYIGSPDVGFQALLFSYVIPPLAKKHCLGCFLEVPHLTMNHASVQHLSLPTGPRLISP